AEVEVEQPRQERLVAPPLHRRRERERARNEERRWRLLGQRRDHSRPHPLLRQPRPGRPHGHPHHHAEEHDDGRHDERAREPGAGGGHGDGFWHGHGVSGTTRDGRAGVPAAGYRGARKTRARAATPRPSQFHRDSRSPHTATPSPAAPITMATLLAGNTNVPGNPSSARRMKSAEP